MALRSKQSGNSMVEFALGAMVLFSAFAGTFQYGYTFYQYNLLEQAVNQGAHYASMRDYDSATASPSNAYLDDVKNVVVYGDPAGSANGASPIIPNLTTAKVNVTMGAFTVGVPTTVTVNITSFTVNAIFGTTTFTGKPTATYPYTGIFMPY